MAAPLRISLRRDGASVAFSILAIGLSVLVLWVSWHLHRQTDWMDLRIYRNAIRSWAHGAALYDYQESGTNHLGFTYPPFGAVVLAPLAMLPLAVAEWGFTALNIAICVFCGGALGIELARRFARPRWSSAILGAAVVLSLEPIRESIGFGQINVVLLALVLADMWLLSTARPGAGIAIGLAAAIKLTPAILILALFASRRTAAGRMAVLSFGAATVLAVAVDPGASRRYWLTEVWETSRVGHPARITDQAWAGVVARAQGTATPSGAAWLCGALAAVLAALVFARLCKGPWQMVRVLTVAAIAATIASPISWTHHYWWAVPALAALVCLAAETRTAASVASAIAVYLMFLIGPIEAAKLTRGWGRWPHAVVTDLYFWAALLAGAALIASRAPTGIDRGRSAVEAPLTQHADA